MKFSANVLMPSSHGGSREFKSLIAHQLLEIISVFGCFGRRFWSNYETLLRHKNAALIPLFFVNNGIF